MPFWGEASHNEDCAGLSGHWQVPLSSRMRAEVSTSPKLHLCSYTLASWVTQGIFYKLLCASAFLPDFKCSLGTSSWVDTGLHPGDRPKSQGQGPGASAADKLDSGCSSLTPAHIIIPTLQWVWGA